MADNTVNGIGFALGLHAGRNDGFIFLLHGQIGGTSFPASGTSGQTGCTSSDENFIPGLARHALTRAGHTSDLTDPAPGLMECASGVSGYAPGLKLFTPAVTGCTSGVVRCVSSIAGGVSGVNRCMDFRDLCNLPAFSAFPDGQLQNNTKNKQT